MGDAWIERERAEGVKLKEGEVGVEEAGGWFGNGANTVSGSTVSKNSVSFLGLKPCSVSFLGGWRRVWGEPGENREPGAPKGEPGAPKRTGGEPGALGKRTGGEPIHFRKSTGAEAGAVGQEPGENRGEGIFFETRDPTQDLKIRTGPPVLFVCQS